ncbi:hypothetical protein HDU98_009196 [Podochytrium sp. JEL0797]|nr:hypothetical protein HDU98_009196 [Podochytrium sp. JEL0797]
MIPLFTSAASFIIDDIRITSSPDSPPEEKKGLLGGAGPFCLFGARLFLSPSSSSSLAYVSHEGSGCVALPHLNALNLTLHRLEHPNLAHPRAWNIFNTCDPTDTNETRGFVMQTPESEYATHFRIVPSQLPESWLDALKYIHVCTSGQRLVNWVKGFAERSDNKPAFVWEPSPNSCKREFYPEFLSALEFADVVSPNHEELAALLGISGTDINLDELVTQTKPLAAKAAFVIRCGARGCIVLAKSEHLTPVSVPAYWTDASRVVDVTGAGNSFLGGLMVGLEESKGDLVDAARFGAVAASFTVQQFGPPVLTVDKDGAELWNGEMPKRRLQQLRESSN